MVRTIEFATECDVKPEFIAPTPQNAKTYYLPPGETIYIVIYAALAESSGER